MDLLWTNSNYNSGFDAQTITLDLSKYIGVRIDTGECPMDDGRDVTIANIIFKNQYKPYLYSFRTTYFQYVFRELSINNSGITFEDAWYFNTGSSNKNNAHAVPYKIYGIK